MGCMENPYQDDYWYWEDEDLLTGDKLFNMKTSNNMESRRRTEGKQSKSNKRKMYTPGPPPKLRSPRHWLGKVDEWGSTRKYTSQMIYPYYYNGVDDIRAYQTQYQLYA